MAKILIIEDDKVIGKFLTMALKTNQHDVYVTMYGVSGLEWFQHEHPDLILLDLGLPDVDGMDVLAMIRKESNVPVIVISARGKETEKVLALDGGADDYVTKPFNSSELLARIRVALRKTNQINLPNVFKYKDLKIDFDKHKVFMADEELHLTPIEFKLLGLLIRHQGKVLTHAFIQKEIWGYESNDDYQSLRVFMAAIRKKIESDPKIPTYIITELGVGYRFMD
jgi:two-component system, OmpR family, KDP operon response regulator KdpE